MAIYENAYKIKAININSSGKYVRDEGRLVYAKNASSARILYKKFLTKKLHYTKVSIVSVKKAK